MRAAALALPTSGTTGTVAAPVTLSLPACGGREGAQGGCLRAGPGGLRQLCQCGCGSALVWGRVGWVGLLLDQRAPDRKLPRTRVTSHSGGSGGGGRSPPASAIPSLLPGAPCVAISGWRALQVRQSAVRAPLSPRCHSGRPLRPPAAGWRLPGAGGKRACLRAGRRKTRNAAQGLCLPFGLLSAQIEILRRRKHWVGVWGALQPNAASVARWHLAHAVCQRRIARTSTPGRMHTAH